MSSPQDPHRTGQPPQTPPPYVAPTPPPYGQQPLYGQQYPGHAYPQYGPQPYGAFYGPPPRVSRRTIPLLGWILLPLGALAILGSCGPWAKVSGDYLQATVYGTDHGKDGTITLVLLGVVAVMGLLIGLGQGMLWTSIVALVMSSLGALTALADLGDLTNRSDYAQSLGSSITVSAQWGLVVVLLASIAAMAVSIVAIVVRRPR